MRSPSAPPHAPLAAAIGAFTTGEPTLARQLYPQLAPDQVLMADRGFFSYTAFTAATATGADLIWRAPTNLKLPLVAALPDGSYTSVLFCPEHRTGYSRQAVPDAARGGKTLDPARGMLVRVVDYDIIDRSQLGANGVKQGAECVTLITIILDADGIDGVDALALARAYAQRWEIETAFDLAKTHLRGPGRVLRSRLPELVTQEIWTLLITHCALVALAARAADAAGIDPDRVSFDRLLHITRRTATGTAGSPPERWAQALPRAPAKSRIRCVTCSSDLQFRPAVPTCEDADEGGHEPRQMMWVSSPYRPPKARARLGIFPCHRGQRPPAASFVADPPGHCRPRR